MSLNKKAHCTSKSLIVRAISHHAPRARKHIKALLKHNNELEKQMSQHESSISRTESLIAKLSHSELRKEIIASNSGKQKSSQNSGEEIRKLQDSIRREQMELLAIEQTTEDLLEKVRAADHYCWEVKM